MGVPRNYPENEFFLSTEEFFVFIHYKFIKDDFLVYLDLIFMISPFSMIVTLDILSYK